MPFVNRPYDKRLSDLVTYEIDPSKGQSRESINVTPPTTAGALELDLGTIVYRAKSTLDPYAPYTRLSAAAQLVDTNEFAIVFGDEYGFNPEFVPNAIVANEFNAVAFKRGPVEFKQYYIQQIVQALATAGGAALTDANLNTLKELLKRQGLVVEKTY